MPTASTSRSARPASTTASRARCGRTRRSSTGPHDTIERDGKELEVYYDGSKVRLVAYRTKKAVYWVSNTLTRDIDKARMIAIAGSLTRIGG